MSTGAGSKVRLLVCGNADRCDDGAAIRAASQLPAAVHAGGHRRLEQWHCGQLDIDHLLDAGGAALLIVDTAIGIEPGRVVTLTLDELLADPRAPAPHSSHAMPIDQVVGVARQLSGDSVEGLFVGIGGADFGFGRALSTPVRSAMAEFVAAISAALEMLSARRVGRLG